MGYLHHNNRVITMSFIIAVLLSNIAALFIIKTKAHHQSITADQKQGVQKFHTDVTPRIGGIVILLGLVGGLVYEVNMGNLDLVLPIGLAISLFPVFIMGILEDLTKKIHAYSRLLMAITSGIAFYTFLKVGITNIGLYWFDTYLLSIPIVSLCLTTVIIAGVSNATNIIDGFNGLLLGFAVMASAGISWVSYQVDDTQILSMSIILLGSIFGLMILNFPKGLIFTGDGGAYLIGYLLSALSILLVNRNEEVSPWFPMLLLLYPITETVFSIFRRIIVDNSSPFDPDNKHLHTLVYRHISQIDKNQLNSKVNLDSNMNYNAQTSILIWPLMLCSIAPSLVFWRDTNLLIIANGLFLIGYYSLYRKLSCNNKSVTIQQH